MYFLIMFLTWHTILDKEINQILQFSSVVICNNQYDEFLFFNCTKNSTHLKIMVPGLRGPAGGPCKSGDITGWGLSHCGLVMSYGVNITLDIANGLLPHGTKPLPEPMLTNHQWGLVAVTISWEMFKIYIHGMSFKIINHWSQLHQPRPKNYMICNKTIPVTSGPDIRGGDICDAKKL